MLVLLGLLLIAVGSGWYVFSSDLAKLNAKVAAGDYAAALAHIRALRTSPWFNAVELLPGLADDIGMKEAYSLYRSGDREAAAKIFRALEDSFNSSLGADALFNATTMDISPETFERAIRDYEEVLKKNPGHLFAQRNLEILRQIEREEREAMGQDGDKEGKDQDGKGDKDSDKKKRSRTKDKLEYRDGTGGESPGDSKSIRY